MAQVEVDLGVEVLVLAQVARAHTHRPPEALSLPSSRFRAADATRNRGARQWISPSVGKQ